MKTGSVLDVLVVGGGPGGWAAAIAAKRAGFEVMLLEKPAARRHRLGEEPVQSMHPGVEFLLENLGASEALAGATVGYFEGIETLAGARQIGSDGGEAWVGLHVLRSKLEDGLRSVALALGVAAKTNLEAVRSSTVRGAVEVGTREGGSHRARFVIDASGAAAVLARSLGLDRRVLSRPLTSWTGSRVATESDLRRKIPRFERAGSGWLWSTEPVGGRVTWTRLAGTSDAEVEAACAYARNVQWRLHRPVVGERTVLVGDAGGIIDPGRGAGVLFAVLSGITAVECIQRCTMHEVLRSLFLAQYDDWFLRRFYSEAETLAALYESWSLDVGWRPSIVR